MLLFLFLAVSYGTVGFAQGLARRSARGVPRGPAARLERTGWRSERRVDSRMDSISSRARFRQSSRTVFKEFRQPRPGFAEGEPTLGGARGPRL